MTEWNLRYASTKTTGESGIDYSKAMPCSGKKECSFCKHIAKLRTDNKDETGLLIDKDIADVHKKILKIHQKGVYVRKENNA